MMPRPVLGDHESSRSSLRAALVSAVSILLTAALCPDSRAQPVLEAEFIGFDCGGSQSQVLLLDLDGDGRRDLVAAAGQTVVLMGLANGFFEPRREFPSVGPFLTTGDFNEDGLVDLVGGGVLLGRGDGTFDRILGGGSGQVAVGDLDEDGHEDIAFGEFGSDWVVVRLGRGDGTFGDASTFPVLPGPNSVALVDLDGDTHLDLTATSFHAGYVSMRRGFGDGTFSTLSGSKAGEAPVLLVPADVNEDGIPDVVVANQDDNSVSILLGLGTGAFQDATEVPVGASPGRITVDDIVGDSSLDLLVPIAARNTIKIFRGTGDGSFLEDQEFLAGREVTSAAVADINEDGFADVVAGTAGRAATVLYGNAEGRFGGTRHFVSDIGPPRDLALADLNGDRVLDLVSLRPGGVSVWAGKGGGSFGQRIEYDAGYIPSSVAVGDVTGDGIPDLVIPEYGSLVSYLPGIGGGLFGDRVFMGEGVSYDVTLGDFDEDGLTDVALISSTNGVVLLLGNGDGTFASPLIQDTVPDLRSIALGDLNEDMHQDLVVTSWSIGYLSVLLGDGSGSFARSDYFSGKWARDVIVADLSGDGHADIALGNGNLLLGNGDGSFPRLISRGFSTSSLVSEDLDRNGQADLVIGASDGVGVMLADAGGALGGLVMYGMYGAEVAAGDVDGDGLPDVVASGESSVILLRNAGPSPTPVELLSFVAVRQGEEVLLEWVIGRESADIVGFQVYRGERGEARSRITESILTGGRTFRFVDRHPPAGAASYWLLELERDGSGTWHGPALVGPGADPVPRPVLAQNRPNPFAVSTRIRFTTPEPGDVLLRVFTLEGREVCRPHAGPLPAGTHEVVWGGTDQLGRDVAAGVYLYTLAIPSGTVTRKLVRMH